MQLITNIIKPNLYQDSVALMQIAARLNALEGVGEASLMMGTSPNKEILREAGLLAPSGEAASPNDLIIALRAEDKIASLALEEVERLLMSRVGSLDRREEEPPHTLSAGLALLPGAALVLISTPGLYAAAEARKALQLGLHAMIFSDNVTIDDEKTLKDLAVERGLLLMGPDCGTAIIGGIPLGFANVVRRGPVGVVGASGTGMQEITTLVDRYGSGISQAIGTGSHDLSLDIGGAMTIMGLRALLNDPDTSVVVLVSKPPHPMVATHVLEVAAGGQKPVVVIFLGASGDLLEKNGAAGITFARTLEEAAQLAVTLAGGGVHPTRDVDYMPTGKPPVPLKLSPGQKYVRGLFSGGTFCSEAVLLLSSELGQVYSNTTKQPEGKLPDPPHSFQHTCLDMGDDDFTVGRPHPMIDMSARADRILAESRDPEVAALLLDVVLGYGSHPDPAGKLAQSIREAKRIAGGDGRELAVVASVCGTAQDPQGLESQRAKLTEAGALLAPSNAAAARLAAALIKMSVVC
jgi:FdrA protein